MSQYESTLTFISESLPAFTVGTAYDFDLEASGGTPPYTFGLTQGALPAGVSLSPSGKVSGVATQAGDTTAFVQLSDAQGGHLTQAFDCQVS